MDKLNQVISCGNIEVRLAQSPDEVLQAQKLRYDMLILDFNNAPTNDSGLDKSDYDDICSHMIAIDTTTGKVVGTYRIVRSSNTDNFVCEHEFDLTNLRSQKCEILETSRAVVHQDYRNGIVLKMLWKGLFAYCTQYNVRYLFGTASFHGTDASKYDQAFAYLRDKYLVADSIDCPPCAPSASLNAVAEYDVAEAKAQIPSLIKGYMAMGAKIANGAYIDYDFNSIDVLTILDLQNMNTAYVQRIIR